MDTNPLPCPFCGNNHIFIGSCGQSFIARCTTCGVSIAPIDWNQSFYDDQRQFHSEYTFDQQIERGKQLAITKWNKRI